DRPDLEPNLERLAFRLERLARDKPWCLTSNDELMRQLGCTRNTLAALLNRGESRGWFRRALVPGRHGRATARLGSVLFVRPPAPRPPRRPPRAALTGAPPGGRPPPAATPGAPGPAPPPSPLRFTASQRLRSPRIGHRRFPRTGDQRSPRIGHRLLVRKKGK